MRRHASAGVLLLSVLLLATACAAPQVAESAPARTPEPLATPESTPTPTPDPAAEAVARMSTAQQAATVVMGHIPSTDPAELRAYMAGGLGGFLLMGANIPATQEDLRALTAALVIDPAAPPLIAIDQEGGVVSRLPWDDLPAGEALQG
ncbi:MAG: glycoside hydrolase family 3 protein, partial [Microbacterium sp.]